MNKFFLLIMLAISTYSHATDKIESINQVRVTCSKKEEVEVMACLGVNVICKTIGNDQCRCFVNNGEKGNNREYLNVVTQDEFTLDNNNKVCEQMNVLIKKYQEYPTCKLFLQQKVDKNNTNVTVDGGCINKDGVIKEPQEIGFSDDALSLLSLLKGFEEEVIRPLLPVK
jgi:hypothetical protein